MRNARRSRPRRSLVIARHGVARPAESARHRSLDAAPAEEQRERKPEAQGDVTEAQDDWVHDASPMSGQRRLAPRRLVQVPKS
jgi:hypothetical protein